MLMQAIAHKGCTDTVRESALNLDSGRKIPRRTGTQPASVLRLASQSDALPDELFPVPYISNGILPPPPPPKIYIYLIMRTYFP